MIKIAYPLLSIMLLIPQLASAATLHVGPSADHKTLAAAIKSSRAGDIILMAPGTYENDFSVIRHALKIKGEGGEVKLLATKPIPNGKGILVSNSDLTLQNLTFEGAQVADRNGAGIRYQGGTLIIEDCIFQDNENGILGGSAADGSIIIRGSQFLRNGYGDGYTHGIYIGKSESLTVERSIFKGTKAGHHIKSRARTNTVSNTLLDDDNIGSSYAIDLPHGGTNRIISNKLIQSSVAHNKVMISTGTKALHPENSLLIANNVFINYANGGTAIRNGMDVPALIKSNTFVGPMASHKGPAKITDNVTLSMTSENAEIEP